MSESVVQPSTAEKKPFVRMRNATQKFAGVTALYALDWDIVPGEVHCLMGENGCGKSTAIKILSGVNIPEPETIIEIDGKEYSRLTPAQSKALGLHVIYQDLSLFPNLTVAENIAMEDALHSLGKLVHRDQMVTRAKAALKREFGLSRLLAVGDVNKEGVPEQRSVGLAQRPPHAVNPFAAARGRDDAPLPKPVGKVAS